MYPPLVLSNGLKFHVFTKEFRAFVSCQAINISNRCYIVDNQDGRSAAFSYKKKYERFSKPRGILVKNPHQEGSLYKPKYNWIDGEYSVGTKAMFCVFHRAY